MSESSVNPFTPPNAAIDGVLPGMADTAQVAERGTRFVAVLLDSLTALPAMILFGLSGAWTPAAGGGPPEPSLAMMGLGGLYFLGLAIYQLFLLSTRGQTLGKKWMGVKIVKMDGSPPGFVHAFLLRAIVNGLIGIVPFYSLVDILFIFREDRRCIHDLIASTKVVKA